MSLMEYKLGRLLEDTPQSETVASGTNLEIAADTDRLGILLSCITFSDTTDFVVVRVGDENGSPLLILSPANPLVYLSMKFFGLLVTGAITVTQGSGDVLVVATKMTMPGGSNTLYLTDEALRA